MKKLLIMILALAMMVSLSAMAGISAYADDGELPREFWCTVNEYASWSLNEREGFSVDNILGVDGVIPPGMYYEVDSWGRLIVSGTPYSVGDYRVNFTLEVNNGADSWGTGFMCIFHVEGSSGQEDYTLPARYETLDAGVEYWLSYDMDSSGSIDDYKLVSGSLPEGMYRDMDRNGVYLGGTPKKGGTYNLTLAAHNSYLGCWVSQPIILTVRGNAAPNITKNPTSETVTEGGHTAFVARADNATSITWYITSADGKTTVKASEVSGYFPGVRVSGTSSEQLNLENIPLSMNGCSAQAKFEGPGGTTYSNSAYITVKKAPLKLAVINSDPADAELRPGESTTLTVSAISPDGNKLSYQWFKTLKNGNYGGTPISGATSASLTVSYEEGTFYYYCAVFNNRDGEISEAMKSSAAQVVGLPAAAPSPTPAAKPTPAPSAKPTEAPKESAAPEKPAEKQAEKADHTVAFIVGGVAAIAMICATLIVIQRGAAKRNPDRYSEQIRRVDEYRKSRRHNNNQ